MSCKVTIAEYINTVQCKIALINRRKYFASFKMTTNVLPLGRTQVKLLCLMLRY